MIKKTLNFMGIFIIGLISWIFMIGILSVAISACAYILSALSMFMVIELIFEFIFYSILSLGAIISLILLTQEIFGTGKSIINKIKNKLNKQ